MEENISYSEKLFRAITSDYWWNKDTNKPTSAAFKDRNGVSVDREGDRNNSYEIESCITNRFQRVISIIFLTKKKCELCETLAVYKPSKRNKYHSLIINDNNEYWIPLSKARQLSKQAEIFKKF